LHTRRHLCAKFDLRPSKSWDIVCIHPPRQDTQFISPSMNLSVELSLNNSALQQTGKVLNQVINDSCNMFHTQRPEQWTTCHPAVFWSVAQHRVCTTRHVTGHFRDESTTIATNANWYWEKWFDITQLSICRCHITNTGRSPGWAEGPASCGHSKIARMCVLNWPLSLLTSV